MKTYLKILAVLIILMTQKAISQVSIGAKFSLIHAHLQYAEGDYVEGVDLSIWSYGAAMCGEYSFSKYLSSKLELGFAQRGSKCEPYYPLPTGASDVKLITRYVTIPLLLKFNYPIFKHRINAFAEVGGSYNWMLNATRYFYDTNGNISNSINVPFDNWDKLNRKDIALEFGVGLGLPLKSSEIQLESRYNHGFKDISFFKSLNRAFDFSIVYLYKL